MSILTIAGRAAIAAAVKAQPLHLAWGPGDGAWVTPPPENPSATALLNEIGRRQVTSCDFVIADPAGTIEVAGAGLFSVSATPTNRLLIVTQFDYADASTSVIRQIGLFMGTQLVAGLPAGQRYFLPGEVQSPGSLVQLENRTPIYRTSGTRERFEMLIVF